MVLYNNKYSGAGVLIIEDYYKNNIIKPCILLVRNRKTQLYSDFGGGYEPKHKTLKITASIELQEESANLFNISEKHFKHYVKIPAGKHYYRVYVLKINGANSKLFNYNINVFNGLYYYGYHVPYCWRETDNIAHIPLRNINFDLLTKHGQIVFRDVNNKNIPISGRCKKCIYFSQPLIYSLISTKPIANINNVIIHKSNSFTNGTFSLTKQ